MSAVVGFFIALLLACAAASALALRQLFRQTRILFSDVERLQDDAIRSGPNLGEVEALRAFEQRVANMLGSPGTTDTALLAVLASRLDRAAELDTQINLPGLGEVFVRNELNEGCHVEVTTRAGAPYSLYVALQRGGRGNEFVGGGESRWVKVRSAVEPKEAKSEAEEFSPVPPPRVKKPRKPRKAKTEETLEQQVERLNGASNAPKVAEGAAAAAVDAGAAVAGDVLGTLVESPDARRNLGLALGAFP